jgi:hypothetical protein
MYCIHEEDGKQNALQESYDSCRAFPRYHLLFAGVETGLVTCGPAPCARRYVSTVEGTT